MDRCEPLVWINCFDKFSHRISPVRITVFIVLIAKIPPDIVEGSKTGDGIAIKTVLVFGEYSQFFWQILLFDDNDTGSDYAVFAHQFYSTVDALPVSYIKTFEVVMMRLPQPCRQRI